MTHAWYEQPATNRGMRYLTRVHQLGVERRGPGAFADGFTVHTVAGGTPTARCKRRPQTSTILRL